MKTKEEALAKVEELAFELDKARKQLERNSNEIQSLAKVNESLLNERNSLAQDLEVFTHLKSILGQIIPNQGNTVISNGAKNMVIENSSVDAIIKDVDPYVKVFSPKEDEAGRIIWALFKNQKPLTISEIAEYLSEYGPYSLPENKIKTQIGYLIRDKWIKKEGSTKDSKYRLPNLVNFKEGES